jgi:hypothetical protein
MRAARIDDVQVAARVDSPGPWTVLVVDDEPGIVDVLRLGLTADDVRVVGAGDVVAGPRPSARSRPRADVGLPGAMASACCGGPRDQTSPS